jgi:hypothetical protein
MRDAKPIKTPMGTNRHLDLDTGGKSVDQKVYRSMIGSILYYVHLNRILCFPYACVQGSCGRTSKLLGPHAPVLVPKTSDGYACAPDNLTGSVRLPQGHRINHLQPEPRD